MMLRAQALIAVSMLALVSGCGGPTGDPGGGWQVTLGGGFYVADFSPSISGIQMLLDGKVVQSISASPTLLMTAGVRQSLSVGTHTMTLKVVAQTGTAVNYTIYANVDMYQGTQGTDFRSFNWPSQTRTMKQGDAVEYSFKVPL